MLFICESCGELFEEDDIFFKETSYEEYLGVTDLPGRHYFDLAMCPFCGSEEIDEYEEDEEEDEADDE